MTWWSTNTVIIAILFIGILLLIIGYFYFGYNKEGFQETEIFLTNPITFSSCPTDRTSVLKKCCKELCQFNTVNECCDPACLSESNDTFCSAKCRTDQLPEMTEDEEQAYGIYETHNLNDANLNAPPVVVPTTVQQYNTAGALTPNDIDPNLPYPWDFDNASLNPAVSLWGRVHSSASKAIFAKCECQALYSDINNLSYDPNSGLFMYESQLFGTEIYDQKEAAALQFAEMFINLEMGKWMGELYEKATDIPGEITRGRIEKLNKIKEAGFKLSAQLTDFNTALAANGGDKIAAAQTLMQNEREGKYQKAWHDSINSKKVHLPDGDIDTLPGVDDTKQGPHKFGRDSIKKGLFSIDLSLTAAENAAILDQLIEDQFDEDLKTQQDRLNGKGISRWAALKNYLSFKTGLGIKSIDKKRTLARTPTPVTQAVSDLTPLGDDVRNRAATRANTEAVVRLSKRAMTSAQVNIAYGILMGIINITGVAGAVTPGAQGATVAAAYLNVIAITIKLLMIAVDLALQTFVPAIFESFLDYDSVCPLNSDTSPMFNLNDYFNGKSYSPGSKFPGGETAGDILLAILTNLPLFGNFLMAFGPYLCFSDNNDDYAKAKGIKIKVNLKSPPYYFDPTLSIYNAGSKPRFRAGGWALDERLFNPLTFHYGEDIKVPKDAGGKAGYPIWVDFANPVILDKMAQFYFDASRKCATTTEDGMLTFEYISKFMGLISTTELTCDVQCEITQITFDPASGVKICESIVPLAPGTLNVNYHDRRFYFYKDLSKAGTINRTVQILGSNTASLEALMRDNVNIYMVTGCTHVDGTAPDCITYDDEGNSVLNPVISLGPVGGTYRAPMVDVGAIATKGSDGSWKLPQNSTCGRQVNFTRYNGITHPTKPSKGITTAADDPQVVDGVTKDNWIYAYKDEHQKYYYPCGNKTTSPTYIKNGVSIPGEIIQAPKGLQTAKYWSIVWNQSCSYEDVDCQINSKQGRNSIIMGTMEGLVGAGFGIGEIHQGYHVVGNPRGRRPKDAPPLTSNTFDAAAQGLPLAGSALQVAMNVQFPGQAQTISQQIQCTYEELSSQEGTYIMNGRVITSRKGFVVDQGPFVKWAPGYVPTINVCKNQSVELYDCVNSYSVRRFVKKYHDANPEKSIKKIYNIAPTMSPEPPWTNESKVQCTYNMDIVDYNRTDYVEVPNTTQNINVALELTQDIANKTCAFTPLEDIITDPTKIYPPVYFSINKAAPAWPLTTDIPNIINTAPAPHLNCSTVANKLKLMKGFNKAHDDSPHFISIEDSKTLSVAGENICIFKGKFGNVYDPETKVTSNKITPVGNSTATITAVEKAVTDNPIYSTNAVARNIQIIMDVSGRYVSDDFPIHYTYTPIPKRSTWFDVPARTAPNVSSNIFARAGCTTDISYNDCSNTALIDRLVTQYNQGNTRSKILKVLRSFTPAVTGKVVCDYDVERLKTLANGKNILNRETLRMYLAPDETLQCAYNLDLAGTNTNSQQVNKGLSLNTSATVGLLKIPYTTAVNYSTSIQKKFFAAMRKYIGFDIPGILQESTSDSLTLIQDLRRELYKKTNLFGCSSKTCMNNEIIDAMVNRFNFDNYPVYPPKQNSCIQNTIVRVTKVGTASPTLCQVELYVRTDFFKDFLYNPEDKDTNYFLHNYRFNLFPTTTECKYKVQPFTQYDISENRMDISGDAFTLHCELGDNQCSSIVRDPKFTNIDTDAMMVHCNITDQDDQVMKLVKNIYNSTVVFTKVVNGVTTKYYNTIKTITKVFNARPNILEFKIRTSRVFWDDMFNKPYYVGDTADDVQDSYLIATWAEGTGYEVETGYYWKDSTGAFVNATGSTPTGIGSASKVISPDTTNPTTVIYTLSRPTLQEIFFPDLNFVGSVIYQNHYDGTPKTYPDGKRVEVRLPYLANDGLIGVLTTQAKRYRCMNSNCLDSDGTAL